MSHPTCLVAHCRAATHGSPTYKRNTHPFGSGLAVVVNGVASNYRGPERGNSRLRCTARSSSSRSGSEQAKQWERGTPRDGATEAWQIAKEKLYSPVPVRVCSANVFLNLSGVGGELLLRYGPEMQQELHRRLSERGTRHVPQGEVVVTPSCGSPFKWVLHAVAVDGAYRSSPSVVQRVVARSLTLAASRGAKRVALTALATGYGRLDLKQFAESVLPLLEKDFAPVEEVAICVRHKADRDELADHMPAT